MNAPLNHPMPLLELDVLRTFVAIAETGSLTTAAEILLGYARRMLAINREAVSKFIVPDIVGLVRLGSPDDYGERILPHVLKRFAQSHPSIAVDVVIDDSGNLRRRLDERA